MDTISNLAQSQQKYQRILKKERRGIRSERDEIMAKFGGRGICLTDRSTKQLRPASLAEIAKLLCFCPTNQLHAFYEECNRAQHFAKFFWWALKGRKIKPRQ